MIIHSDLIYGRESRNLINATRVSDISGARALIETFYFAFNTKDLGIFSQVWADHELIQLNNPLGGIVHGHVEIYALYRRIFTSEASVWVELVDSVEFQSEQIVVFAGSETGEFTHDGETLALQIRTSRVVQWMRPEIGWRQVHHHGSIDNAFLLSAYQNAVK